MSAVSTPEPRDEHGREGRADSDRREPEHLDDAEDAREHVVGDGALHEREPGDVDERVPDAHAARSSDERDAELLPEPERDRAAAPHEDDARA